MSPHPQAGAGPIARRRETQFWRIQVNFGIKPFERALGWVQTFQGAINRDEKGKI